MTEQKLPGKTVRTIYGDLRGVAEGESVWAWYGVPYARPPLGELRWKPPLAPEPWQDVRDAFKYGDQAAQNLVYKPYGLGGMSEDCLHLNILAPRQAKDLPVMVWLHGGAFMMLTANMRLYNNPEALPAKGVVLVTVNHRLGPFGYLAHPLLSEESGYGGSGNYGQMDLIAALQWVRDNIAAFGGDPGNVTIFGQSGGGAKAISLMASPLATGLFKRAICQSGMVASGNDFMNSVDLAAAEARGISLSQRLGAESLSDLRAVPWQKIIASDNAHYMDNIAAYGPNIDGYYAMHTTMDAIRNGLASDVPFMAGANATDLVSEGDLVPGLLEQMPLRAAHCQAPQYVYCFRHLPAGWRAVGGKAYHGAELVYLFNFPSSFVTHYFLGLTGLSIEQIGDPDGNGSKVDMADIQLSTRWGAEDEALADQVMSLWANFAKNGNPSIPGVIEWPRYTLEAEHYLEIATPLAVKTGLATGFG
ncbi:MAG: carboxylesterase family protein [Desulfobacteraceae bacterium]|nr:carboxylesterase family protein [Desulfobacteraceae bacterium]